MPRVLPHPVPQCAAKLKTPNSKKKRKKKEEEEEETATGTSHHQQHHRHQHPHIALPDLMMETLALSSLWTQKRLSVVDGKTRFFRS